MDLIVKNREKFGKAVKALRRDGLIPAELYGHGIKNAHISVPVRDFGKVFKEAGQNTVVNLLLDKAEHPALIYGVAKDYLTGEITHVDFYQVKMDEKIKAKVPFEFAGNAPAVGDKGGVLNRVMSEVEVEALPADLPRRLTVDLSPLTDLNASIYLKDIVLPKGVKFLIDLENVIVTVTAPAAEEEKAEAPADLSAVKVEAEEKKAERQTENAESGKKEKEA